MQFAPNFVTRKCFGQGLWGLLGRGAARRTHGACARSQGRGTRAALRSLGLAGLGAGLLALVPVSVARADVVGVPSECQIAEDGTSFYYTADSTSECYNKLVISQNDFTAAGDDRNGGNSSYVHDGYPLKDWYTGNITTMDSFFYGYAGIGDGQGDDADNNISDWNTSNVEDMDFLFRQTTNFNQDLSDWDVSSATRMFQVFYQSVFNGDLSAWDVSKVTLFADMFNGNTSFTGGGIGTWDTSSAERMDGMFAGASAFNENLNNWNVEKVAYTFDMFTNASSSIALWETGDLG